MMRCIFKYIYIMYVHNTHKFYFDWLPISATYVEILTNILLDNNLINIWRIIVNDSIVYLYNFMLFSSLNDFLSKDAFLSTHLSDPEGSNIGSGLLLGSQSLLVGM